MNDAEAIATLTAQHEDVLRLRAQYAEITPRWSILIATLAHRRAKLLRLLAQLLPQAEAAAGQVEVVGCHNYGDRPLGVIRQHLMGAARGAYLSFVDDDDTVVPDFVSMILSALTPVDGEPDTDVVGFNVDYYCNGTGPVPTYCSLMFEPHDEPDGLYRDLTHVQPVRADLARRGDFTAEWPEDRAWHDRVRPHLATEVYIGRVLYTYWHSTADSVQTRQRPRDAADLPRPEIDSPVFRWAEPPAGEPS